ncbi:MAG: TlpA family protein disulfide reductase [Anaerolineae bacterium]|nr:TlpA family protein disulfide reductase [Anaerolineae bacterium]
MKKDRKTRKYKKDNSLVLAAFGVLLLLLGIVMAVFLQDSRATVDSETTSRSVIPMAVDFPAPELALETVKGTTETLEDYRGRVVLVNNWATWCPPCKAEMPSLQKFYQAHEVDGFAIIAVNAGDSRIEVDQFAQSYGLTFSLWLDPDGAAIQAFRNGSLPSSYVIDHDGIVRYAWTGEISYEMLEKYVAPLIQELN